MGTGAGGQNPSGAGGGLPQGYGSPNGQPTPGGTVPGYGGGGVQPFQTQQGLNQSPYGGQGNFGFMAQQSPWQQPQQSPWQQPAWAQSSYSPLSASGSGGQPTQSLDLMRSALGSGQAGGGFSQSAFQPYGGGRFGAPYSMRDDPAQKMGGDIQNSIQDRKGILGQTENPGPEAVGDGPAVSDMVSPERKQAMNAGGVPPWDAQRLGLQQDGRGWGRRQPMGYGGGWGGGGYGRRGRW